MKRGDRLTEARGVRPGDTIHILGWTSGSVDMRQVVALISEPCEGGVMAVIDRPLKNQVPGKSGCAIPGKTWISLSWAEEAGGRE